MQGGGEAAGRRHDVQDIAGLEVFGNVAGEDAVGDALDADPQPPGGGRGADGVVAPHLVAHHGRPDRHVLPGLEAELLAQLRRNVEGDGHRVVGQPLDAGHAERVEHRVPPQASLRTWLRADLRAGLRPGHHRALKESKGSAQDRHVHSALQAVEPKWLTSLVSAEPQCGQRAENASCTGPAGGVRGGSGRCDPVLAQLAPPRLAHPVGRPRRGQHGADTDLVRPGPAQGVPHVVRDDRRGRAAGVSGGEVDLHGSVACHPQVPDHAQVAEGQDGELGIGHGPGRGQQRRRVRRGAHHVAPGYERCRCCISASRCPRCSVCRPSRPPRERQRGSGLRQVASLRTAVT